MARTLKEMDVDLESLLAGETLEEKKFMFEVEPEKAFQKLSENQFSDPYQAYRELVANSLDAYVEELKKERKIDLVLTPSHFSITDYGSGMDEEHIRLLRTLGLTEKKGNKYIGRFGIGFASLFHPDLEVSNVVVDTRSNGNAYRLVFKRNNGGLSYKRYQLDTHLDFSTRMTVAFNEPNYGRAAKIEEQLRKTCERLKASVNLNGKLISGEQEYDVNDYEYKHVIDNKGITGFVALGDKERYQGRVNLQAHGFDVDNIHYHIFINNSLPLFDFIGVVNYDGFNLVSSRNQIKEDEAYEKFMSHFVKEMDQFLCQLAEDYQKTPSSELKDKLVKLFDGLNIDWHLPHWKLKEYIENPREFEKEDNVRYIGKMAKCGLFEGLESERQFSLDDICKMHKEQRHILVGSQDADLQLLEEAGYRGIVIDKETLGNGTLLRNLQYCLKSVYDVDELRFGNRLFRKLARERIIDPKKIDRDYQVIPDTDLSVKEMAFLNSVRELMEGEYVRATLQKHDIPENIGIFLGRCHSNTSIAVYSPREKKTKINLNSPVIQNFISSSDSYLAARMFLPILSHELTHDAVLTHGNPFYKKRDPFNKDLNEAVAREEVDKYHKERISLNNLHSS